jgi:HlyD family secretion protein
MDAIILMRFNILYLLLPAAIAACWWIARDFEGQRTHAFFGIAETESQVINFDHDVSVRSMRVKVGDLVKKGDTLAILYRADLDRNESAQRADMARTEVERAAEASITEKEKALVLAQMNAKKRELQSEIRLLRTEDSLQQAFRKNVYPDLQVQANQVTAGRLAALTQEVADLEAQAREEIKILEARQSAQRDIATSKSNQNATTLTWVRAERDRLVLISPLDGYVESLYFASGALVPAHRDLIKVNPQVPNRIIGFIHEGAEVPFVMGQEVDLSSYTRKGVTTRGRIIGSNPRMTELPLRLRKFVEMRSWGREVFIQLPDSNRFYISEKIIVALPNLAQ